MLFAGDTLAVLHLVSPDRASSGLATLSMVRQCGSVLGVAVLGAAADAAGRLVGNTVDGLRLGLVLGGLGALPAVALLGRYLLGPQPREPLTETV
jgi:hypothetical protein